MKITWVLLARALALLWAGFWMCFFVVESWRWHTAVGPALFWVAAGLLFILLALIPWRWELLGAFLLVVVGFSVGVAYTIWSPPHLSALSRVLTTLFLGGPPIAAGILFLMHRRVVDMARMGVARG